MPTIIDCPSCSRKLQVPDALLGQQVRCPTCTSVFEALATAKPPPEESSSEPLPLTLPSPPTTGREGWVRGPSANEPVSEPSRASPTPSPCPLPRSGGEGWVRGPECNFKLVLDERIPPTPAGSAPRGVSKGCLAYASGSELTTDDFKSCPNCGERLRQDANRCRYCGEDLTRGSSRHGERRPRYVRRDCEPHRAGLILTFGILSIVLIFFCMGIVAFPFGVAGWIMGQRDLRKINAGTMDGEGRSSTQAGWVCSIIGTILSGLILLLLVAYMVIIMIAAMYSSNSGF